ncbi:glycoside hydrolase superfamily [Obelidium mucronatum]|nr:glycoside hydrolase superfamily [Obelidium mucronatum]
MESVATRLVTVELPHQLVRPPQPLQPLKKLLLPLHRQAARNRLIGYWNEQYGEPLATICKQGYNVVNVYNLAHFGYESDFPEQPNGVITSSITDIAACRALGVKVVLVLGGANGAKYSVDGYPSGYSIKNGASLAKSLWNAYFSKNQFDGVDFDIEGLYNNHGTGSDLAAMITYFRQQGGSNFIISLAPYSNYDGTEDAQAVVRDGISRAKTSISYLNVQTYRVYYSGVEDNGLIQANYNWYAAQYGIPINIGINVCVDMQSPRSAT